MLSGGFLPSAGESSLVKVIKVKLMWLFLE